MGMIIKHVIYTFWISTPWFRFKPTQVYVSFFYEYLIPSILSHFQLTKNLTLYLNSPKWNHENISVGDLCAFRHVKINENFHFWFPIKCASSACTRRVKEKSPKMAMRCWSSVFDWKITSVKRNVTVWQTSRLGGNEKKN